MRPRFLQRGSSEAGLAAGDRLEATWVRGEDPANLGGRARGSYSANAAPHQKARSIAVGLLAALALGACGEPAVRPTLQTPVAAVKPAPRELSTTEIAQRTLPSVVAVKTPDGIGTGFFVSPDLVVTCLHVVRGTSDIRMKSVSWQGRAISVVAWSEDDDLAVLRVTPAGSGRGLRIDRGPYVVGTKVVAVSSPLGLEDTVSEGIISALRSDPHDRLQFTAPISPGSSGGPIMNAKGEVTGMVAGFRATVDRGLTIGQNLNFAVPASLVLIAMATPNDVSLQDFATQTVPAEEKKWREIEAGLSSLDSNLVEELGVRVGRHFGALIRQAVAGRNGDQAKALIERANELKGFRKNLMERAQKLHSLGEEGPQIANALVSAWEDWAINPTEATSRRLGEVDDRGVAFAQVLLQRLQRPSLPERFAGLPFMGSFAVISEYCWGYRQEAVAGLSYLKCPKVPVEPPFASGAATLEFLDGALVTVSMDVKSYEAAVRAISEKYGEPRPGKYVNGHWETSDKASFAANTAFNWTLNGGRVRVGRTKGKAFVVLIRDERDRAIDSSF